MIPVSERRRIQALLRGGRSKASVARETGVSLRSVKRIAKEPELDHTDDARERRRRGIGRPSLARAFRELVLGLLREDPDLKSAEILRRARDAGYEGGKSALYALVASLRPLARPGRPAKRLRRRPEKSDGLGAG